MKKLIPIFIMMILCQGQSSFAQTDTIGRDRIYRIWIIPVKKPKQPLESAPMQDTERRHFKYRVLYDVKDSSVLIANSGSKSNLDFRKSNVSEVKAWNIKEIMVKKQGFNGLGKIIGAVIGPIVVTSVAVTLNSDRNIHNDFNTAGLVSIALVSIPIGIGIGAIFDNQKTHIPINGSQEKFDLNREILYSYSLRSNNQPHDIKKRLNPKARPKNDVYIGYNYWSIFTNNPVKNLDYPFYSPIYNLPSHPQSIGGLSIGYNHALSKVIKFGFLLGYENLHATGNYQESNNEYSAKIEDNVFSELAVLTLNYMNKPMVRIYSAFGAGLAFSFLNVMGNDPGATRQTSRNVSFAGQFTFLGLSVGRTLGGFFEVGVGTTATLTAGINYRFRE